VDARLERERRRGPVQSSASFRSISLGFYAGELCQMVDFAWFLLGNGDVMIY
jgi:hypothetical protein